MICRCERKRLSFQLQQDLFFYVKSLVTSFCQINVMTECSCITSGDPTVANYSTVSCCDD